ncbi:MAG: hypothetical protein K1060chlam2_00593, partial [Chlamydiae bacterium]|nr:hypothetical protein [Chlamydiota bacterium]
MNRLTLDSKHSLQPQQDNPLVFDTSGQDKLFDSVKTRALPLVLKLYKTQDRLFDCVKTRALPLVLKLFKTKDSININFNVESSILPLSCKNIDLLATGGKGRKGQTGAEGEDGRAGRPGKDATQYKDAGNGGTGTDGGNGGAGQGGGDGGNGGIIAVFAEEKDKELFMLINRVCHQGGEGGEGGHGGPGGLGGRGGWGGAGGSWTEMGTASTYDADGAVISTYTTTKVVRHVSRDEGNPGKRGRDGKTGKRGRAGRRGVNGSIHFCVEDERGEMHRYAHCYDLKASFDLDDNSNGFYEPGEELSVPMTFQNMHEMSTPSNQDITVDFKPNSWIQPLETQGLPRVMQKGCIHKREIGIRIADHDRVAVGKAFKIEATLSPRATMLPLNKTFKGVEKIHKRLKICYPIKLQKIIKSISTITTNDETPLAFLIENISKLSLGSRGEESRLIQCSVSPKNSNQNSFVVIRDRDGKINSDQPWCKVWNFDQLKRGRQSLSATVSFVGEGMPLYTKVELVARLQIGVLKDPMGELKTIQEREFTIQLSENYIYDDAAEFLIVTNIKTSGKKVQAWRSLLREVFDSNPMVWNISLHNGLSLEHKFRNGTQLIVQIANKTLIILNNKYKVDGKNKQRASSQIPQGELFRAAKEAGIKTLLVGSKEPLENFAQPQFDMTS